MDGSISTTSTPDLREQIRAALRGSKGTTQTTLAREIGIGASTLSQWLSGSYPGDVSKVESDVQRWLSARARASTLDVLPAAPSWVETPLARQVYDTLTWAQVGGDIVIAYGAAGLGKTATAKRYAVDNPNVFMATMSPASAAVVTALTVIAEALGIESAGGGAAALHRLICKRLRGTRGLLIIDEAQFLSVQALEQIRTIHDECEVGIAYVGNEGLYTQMASGRNSVVLDRLFSRIGKRARLPKASTRDVDALAGAWGVPEGECRKQMYAIASKPGALRGLTKVLRRAQAYASAATRAICCEDIASAWAEIGGEG